MVRYMVLLNFTEQGLGAVSESVKRSEAFRAAASERGASVEAVYWTQGTYDGMFILAAPDEATAAAVTLDLSRKSNVHTRMLRAFNAEEFQRILAKLS